MSAEASALSAAQRLARAFAGLVAVERLSRAFESLLIGAACAWVLTGVAQFEGARAALLPSALAGLLAGASWMIERWRDRREIAARADRVLATPQLLDTALAAPQASAPGWGELLARRALARFDRTRLWLAAAPAWTAAAALVLLAAGTRELLVRCAPVEPAPAPLAGAWKTLAEELESASSPAGDSTPASRAELAAELRLAAEHEAHGELGAAAARALLERALERLSPGDGTPSGAAPEPASVAGSLALLQQAYGRPPSGSEAGSEAGIAGNPSTTGGSGVPSAGGDGTMGGSSESGPVRLPAPAGPAGVGAEGALRPTLSARWWPRDQDRLVEAWIARSQQPRSKR